VPPDEVLQRERCLVATTPFFARDVQALLSALRCVDSVQPDALTVDLDGVTIDDRGAANDVRVGGAARANHTILDHDEP
jgi:hypothetical protein